MKADKKFAAAVIAMLTAAPLYAQVDLNQGSLRDFRDSAAQTAVATPASAPAHASAPQTIQAVPVGRGISDVIPGDRQDGFSLVSLRQLEENAKDPVTCGWNGIEGPMPCPTVFHPLLKDGDALGVEYADCDVNPGIEIPVNGCGSSVLFTLPGLVAKDGKVTLNGEVVAQVKGKFLKSLKLVNGYRFAVTKTPAVETRGGDYAYPECTPINPMEGSTPCTLTGRILHENDAHQVKFNQLAVYLTK
ncbi:MAG: hypothetical protein ACHQ49_10625 [Elusimicrobiota bacterium]